MLISPGLVGKTLAVTAAVVTPTGLFIDSAVKSNSTNATLKSTEASLKGFTEQYNKINFLINKAKCNKKGNGTVTEGSVSGTEETSAVCKGIQLIDPDGKTTTGNLHLEPSDANATTFVNALNTAK